MSTTKRLWIFAALLTAAACTVKETPAPPLSGPSELGLRVALQMVPDSILQDGASQAALQIEASGADGRPMRGLGLRIEVSVGGQIMDYGTLSAKSVVTGEDGRARVTYTAPPKPAEPVEQQTVVEFGVTPIGSDYAGQTSRSVSLRLVTPGVIQPPNAAPQPDFTQTPESAEPLQDIVFDASSTMDEGASCGAACTYQWEFGDGGTATGIFVRHLYQTMGTYQLRLTATDARGASATIARPITIGQATPPTASFTFSPSSPAISQTIFFNAEASRPAPGRRLVSYSWDFGSGRTGTGITTSKSYDTAGTYIVTLTVEDDAGAIATTSQPVTVGASGTGPTADLSISPTTGTTSTIFFLDASATTGPSPIVEYRFTFGDNTPDVVGTAPTTSHRFTLPGTYTVRVTVRDSANRTSTETVSVSVGTP